MGACPLGSQEVNGKIILVNAESLCLELLSKQCSVLMLPLHSLAWPSSDSCFQRAWVGRGSGHTQAGTTDPTPSCGGQEIPLRTHRKKVRAPCPGNQDAHLNEARWDWQGPRLASCLGPEACRAWHSLQQALYGNACGPEEQQSCPEVLGFSSGGSDILRSPGYLTGGKEF